MIPILVFMISCNSIEKKGISEREYKIDGDTIEIGITNEVGDTIKKTFLFDGSIIKETIYKEKKKDGWCFQYVKGIKVLQFYSSIGDFRYDILLDSLSGDTLRKELIVLRLKEGIQQSFNKIAYDNSGNEIIQGYTLEFSDSIKMSQSQIKFQLETENEKIINYKYKMNCSTDYSDTDSLIVLYNDKPIFNYNNRFGILEVWFSSNTDDSDSSVVSFYIPADLMRLDTARSHLTK